jgi:hypothetical protein
MTTAAEQRDMERKRADYYEAARQSLERPGKPPLGQRAREFGEALGIGYTLRGMLRRFF